jgi:hypothetical protein
MSFVKGATRPEGMVQVGDDDEVVSFTSQTKQQTK